MEHRKADPPDRAERGIALILVLLVVVLMYVLVAELVTRSQYDSMASANQANEVKIRGNMRKALKEILQALADDLDDDAQDETGGATAPGGGGLGGLGNLAGGPGAGAAEEPAEEPDIGDHSRDSWFEPKSWFDDNEIVVYGWVVDESRKFNILSLVAKDEKFAELSKQRLVRLLDKLWDDTDHDLGASDAETWANQIQEFLKGSRFNDDLARPTLRSNEEGKALTLVPTLDYLKGISQIPEEVFEDRFVENGVFLPGLHSVLTVHTALEAKGGGSSETTQTTGGNEAEQGGAQQPEETPAAESGTMLEPGIRINVNSASRAVLSCIATEQDVPPMVIDAILRYRNEEDEEARQKAEDAQAAGDESALLSADEGQQFRKIFRSLDDLEEVPEWRDLANSKGKDEFLAMLTTQSRVFTVHLAGIHKRGQNGKAFSIMRQRGIYVRLEGADGAKMQVLVPMHRITAIRVSLPDFPDEEGYVEGDIDLQALDDPFRAEERIWNPFFLDFYDPKRRAAVLEAR